MEKQRDSQILEVEISKKKKTLKAATLKAADMLSPKKTSGY